MPSNPWPGMFLAELARLRSRRTWTEPRPIYVATGLLLAALVIIAMIGSIMRPPAQPVQPVPAAQNVSAPLPQAAVKEAPAEAPAVAPAPPAAVSKTSEPGRIYRPLAGEAKLAFGWQPHPVYGDWRYHPGVDIAAAPGGRVKAAFVGRVTDVYEDSQFGLTVVVEGGGYSVYYGSLAAAHVEKGERVPAGTVIGVVGQSRSEPYHHLHLAVKGVHGYVDPAEVLSKAE